MTDYQSQIEDQRGKIKELLLKVPGFKGYIEIEDRRTADKLLRDAVADSYQEQLDRLTAVQTEFVDRGDLSYVDDLEAVVVKLRTFIDRISHATYGYSSFFSAIKIDAEKLDKIYDYDQALLNGIDGLSAAREIQFRDLFDRLGVADTRQYVEQHISKVVIEPNLEDYLLGGVKQEDTSDLAD